MDPCKSTITIIQRIGRAVRNDGSITPASVIVSIYVDSTKYDDCKTKEDVDQVLRESMTENGDFSVIFSILVALKQVDPERYYNIMHSSKVKKYQNETNLSINDSKKSENTLLDHLSNTLGKDPDDIKNSILDYMENIDKKFHETLKETDNWDSAVDLKYV